MKPKVMSAREAVRQRPGMYFGPSWTHADSCVFELVANSIDCFLRGEATRLQVEVEHGEIWVADDGPGLPFGEPRLGKRDRPLRGTDRGHDCLTRFHFSATQDGHAPHIHLQFSGLGLGPVNAICESLSVQSWRRGKCWREQFRAGKPIAKPEVIQDGSGRGTAFRLLLDHALLPAARPRLGVIRQVLFNAAHLFPGLQIEFNGERFCAPGGLADLAMLLCQDHAYKPLDRLFHTTVADAEIRLEVAALGDLRDEHEHREIRSWMNGSNTSRHGTHVRGVLTAFRRAGWKPEVLLVNAIMLNPQFAGPVKWKVANPDLAMRIPPLLRDALRAFLAEGK